MSPAGNNVLVTGTASGIGRAVFERLDALGANLTALDRAPHDTGKHRFVECDLTDADAIDRAIKGLPDALHALVNVAGAPGTIDPVTVMQVNFLGLRHLTNGLIDRLQANGRVINIASISGANWKKRLDQAADLLATEDFSTGTAWCADHPRSGQDAYTFSKECVIVYTKQLAGVGQTDGFTCNAISPGPIATPLLPTFHEQEHPGQIDWVIEQIGHPGEPDDIAGAVAFLLSDDARWINGQDIQIDGGFLAGIDTGWIDSSQSPANLAKAAAATPVSE